MAEGIKMSLDGIRAEDKLKSDTILYLHKKIAKQRKAQGHITLKRYAAVFASFIILLMTGIFTYHLYFTTAAYVDVDVNPSIELMLNRFDRVIGSHAYNDDGDNIINGLSLMHKSYGEALVILMESMTRQGYFQDDVLVSVTLQTDDEDKEKILLDHIQTGIEGYMMGHHHTAQIDVFPVSSSTRSYSYEQGVSPAKYLAIQELIEVDPTASIENCRSHSISEIKQLVQDHENHHNNRNSDDFHDPTTGYNGSCYNGNTDNHKDTKGSEQENGHHGANNGSSHRGSGH